MQSLRVSLCLLIAITLAACGGGTSGSSGGGGSDNVLPTATIEFPHIDGLITVSGYVTIRGSANDNVSVKRVLVNDIEATSTSGGSFNTWQAKVYLPSGKENVLNVKVEDVNGNINESSAVRMIATYQAENLPVCGNIEYDPLGQRVLNSYPELVATDVNTGARIFYSKSDYLRGITAFNTETGKYYGMDDVGNILEVSFSTGSDSIVSGDGVNGISFPFGAMTIDSSSNALFVYSHREDSDQWGIYSVDVSTGARSVVASDSMGAGLELRGSSEAEIAAANGRLFALLWDDAVFPTKLYLLEIDRSTGNRSIISGGSYGSGYPLGLNATFTVDQAAEKAYIGNYSDELIETDLETGERRLVSAAGEALASNLVIGTGGISLAVDDVQRKLYLSCASNQLIAIDINSGSRMQLVNPLRGEGPPINESRSIRFDSVNDRILVINKLSHIYMPEVMSVDPKTGDRKILTSEAWGAGELAGDFYDFVVGKESGRILVAASLNNPEKSALMEIDQITGDRKVISGERAGLGPAFNRITALEINETSGIVYALDEGVGALFSVDLMSGDRTVISQPGGAGSGEEWESPAYMALSPDKSTLYISEQSSNSIYSVDVVTGYRKVFLKDKVEQDSSMEIPRRLHIDPVRNKLIIESLDNITMEPTMVFIDLETGSREYRASKNIYTNYLTTVDPEAGNIYRATSSGYIAIYDYDSAEEFTISQ